jgi:hypothetical protein
MSVVDCSFDHPLKLEEKASAPLAGGVMMHGYQCGMLWGGALAAGAQAYQLFGPGAQAETGAVLASQKVVGSFLARNKTINCDEMTGVDWQMISSSSPSPDRVMRQALKFLGKGGPALCFGTAARYAPAAQREIIAALSTGPIEALSPSVSCTAVLAQQMGVSDLHTVMAAGCAGGIGLSGGACGALGAAIWIQGMAYLKEGRADDLWTSEVFRSKVEDTIECFLESSDYEFECGDIVGRKFEDARDHAAYVHGGGCAQIIAALAGQ